MKGLNLSKFKKMASDGRTTTLKHPEGHKIIIAHASISPEMKKKLDELPRKFAEGGDTEDVPGANGDLASANGGGFDAFKNDVSSGLETVFGKPAPAIQSGIDFASKYNTTANQSMADKKLHISPEERSGLDAVRSEEGPLPSDNSPSALMSQGPAPASIPDPGMQPQSQAQEAASAEDVPNAALEGAAQAQYQPTKEYQHSLADFKQAHQKEFAEQDAAFAQDLNNGHITPKNYHDLFANKSTLGKIGTLFGLMVSGAGSGLSGQPNAVLQGMDNEIKNDLEAQVRSKENAQNFIKLNQSQMKNAAEIENMKKTGQLTDAQAKAMNAQAGLHAFTLSQLQANRAAFHNQAQMVAKMPEGPQKEQAKAALAMMGMAVTNENANISDIASSKMALMSHVAGGTGNTTLLRMMGMEKIADDIEKKTIPGIGRSQIPLTSDDRTSVNSGVSFQNELGRFIDWTKKHSGSLNPTEINEGKAMAAQLQGAYRMATHGGVYKEGEQGFISHVIDSDPTKFFNSIRVLPKLHAVQQESAAQLDQLMKSKGLTGYRAPQSSMVTVVSPSGQRGSIPRENLQKAIKQGYKAAQ